MFGTNTHNKQFRIHKNNCMDKYYKLLVANTMHTPNNSTASCDLIRDFINTKSCDNVVNFSLQRTILWWNLSKEDEERPYRIQYNKQTLDDINAANKYCTTYSNTNTTKIFMALNTKNKIKYNKSHYKS